VNGEIIAGALVIGAGLIAGGLVALAGKMLDWTGVSQRYEVINEDRLPNIQPSTTLTASPTIVLAGEIDDLPDREPIDPAMHERRTTSAYAAWLRVPPYTVPGAEQLPGENTEPIWVAGYRSNGRDKAPTRQDT